MEAGSRFFSVHQPTLDILLIMYKIIMYNRDLVLLLVGWRGVADLPQRSRHLFLTPQPQCARSIDWASKALKELSCPFNHMRCY